MMGSVLDRDHQALTFFIFLVVNPVFIMDKPWRNISFTTFWLFLFIFFSFKVKDYSLFRGDFIHAMEFYFASIFVTGFVINIRINSIRMNKELEDIAMHDFITGVYNREAVVKRAKEYSGKNLALAIVTVESLDIYNDMFGAEFGDDVMNDFVSIIHEYFSENDIYQLSRRKLVLIDTKGTEVDIIRNMNLIKAEFVEHLYNRYELYLTFSTGYIVGTCKSDVDLKMMIRQADFKCLQASQKSRGSIEGGAYDRTEKYNTTVRENFDRYVRKDSLDELTGLLNMRGFFSKTQEILQLNPTLQTTSCFAYFNIENMKEYNSKYGYEQGNELIKNVGNSIQSNVGKRLVARFGDDHYIALLFRDEAEDLVERIIGDMKEFHRIASMSLKCGLANWDTELTALEGSERARIACDSLKNVFSKNVAWFDEEMLIALDLRNYLVDNLDKALEQNAIKVYYQPVVDLNTGEIKYYEALSRWHDEEEGILGPDKFIPVLEEARLINKLDIFVIRNVLNDMKMIQEGGGKPFAVSINLSYYDFALSDMHNQIPELVDSYGIDRSLINFEVSESAFFIDSDVTNNSVKYLKEAGFSVWLDDYGSRYSSLNIVMFNDFSVIKLDMKYVRNMNENRLNKSYIRSMSRLCKDRKCKILALGVENKEQHEVLKEAEVEYVQGYYYGVPKTMSEMLSDW
jgi:diguanylate cyclase (GGDEF)-like protein